MFLVALRERTISKTICLEPVDGRIDFRNAARKKEKIFGKIFCKKCYTFEKILHIKYEKMISQIAKTILCKLRNEVFTASEIRLNTECSLTSSEGISVPSLYVRVYRTLPHHK